MTETDVYKEILRKINLVEYIEKLHQAITEKFPINSKYMFSINEKFENDLDRGIIPDLIRLADSENCKIIKEKNNEWSIISKNEKIYIIRKEVEKLNFYFCFDAWYTNRYYVLQKLEEFGRNIAEKVRNEFSYSWSKGMSDQLSELLQMEGTFPKNWEDGPDGCLAGMAIILAGWGANQTTAKTRDNPQDCSKILFEKHIRTLINASMDFGIKMAEREENKR
jgi:hypothetical protein